MPFNEEAYIDKVQAMTIRELQAGKDRLNREWSSAKTSQYGHMFASVFTGPFGAYKSVKYGSRGIDCARKSAIVDAEMKDLEAYTHSRRRDFLYGGGTAVATTTMGHMAGELAEASFNDLDPNHRYEFEEKLANKGIEKGVE
jgi:hypothetical protein